MIRIQSTNQNNNGLTKYLSPVAVWALAFGSAVGWGAFVMPGTTFLPIAGPWGSVIGLLIGAVIMLIIGLSYRVLMERYPDAGGSYTFAAKVLGSDHGAADLRGDHLGEQHGAVPDRPLPVRRCVLLRLFVPDRGLHRLYGRGAPVCRDPCRREPDLYRGQTSCGMGADDRRVPAFRGDRSVLCHRYDPSRRIRRYHACLLRAGRSLLPDPDDRIGFESISHSAEEFRFKPKRILPILIAALAAGALAYTMLTLCASVAVPDGFRSWSDYIGVLSDIDGIRGLPTFYAAQSTMGTPGLVILGIASFCGIFTGLIGNMIALSRLIYRMSADNMLPKPVGQLDKKGIPSRALWCVAIISMIIPFFGRTAIGWIVDVTTIGATIVYIYVSICAAIIGKREKKLSAFLFGMIGGVIAVIFALFYLLPHIRSQSELAAESYMILILWSLIGMIVFRSLMQRDKTRLIGKSTVVWIILFCLILLVSVSWVNRTTVDHAKEVTQEVQEVHTKLAGQAGLEAHHDSVTQTNRYLDDRFNGFAETVRKNILILGGLLLGALLLIFSIFSIIKKREQLIEAERLLAEENSRAKSTFLSNMSHDIRTPMNAITGYTALALKEDGVPDSTRAYLEKIDTSGKQLLSLINDILDMSHIESGKMELDPAPADLIETFDETCHIFDLQMQAKPLTYTVDHSGVKDRYVVCDKSRLNRILLNLISNAYKYTPSGGSVSVRLKEYEISGSERTYEISVSDTGIGMSKEFAERIFDSFERERSRTVDAIQGTGLGMAITKKFVEMMNGTILIETEQGKGSTFTVRLSFPLAKEDEVHTASDQSENEKIDFSGVRLLLADDNPINIEIASMILTQEGFTVDVAENGQIAADMVGQSDEGYYSAILMDIQMPVMNGYDATRRIRAMSGKNARIPIIAITANTFETDRQEAFEAGMNAHVAKPFNPDELLKTLAACIKEK